MQVSSFASIVVH